MPPFPWRLLFPIFLDKFNIPLKCERRYRSVAAGRQKLFAEEDPEERTQGTRGASSTPSAFKVFFLFLYFNKLFKKGAKIKKLNQKRNMLIRLYWDPCAPAFPATLCVLYTGAPFLPLLVFPPSSFTAAIFAYICMFAEGK